MVIKFTISKKLLYKAILLRIILFIIINAISTYTYAQGFNVTQELSDIDSLLQNRVNISEEAEDLFNYLTEFKYYNYDEINEFHKAKQVEKNNKIIYSLENSWQLKYKITFTNNVINSGKESDSFLYLNPYDFQDNTFRVSFGKIAKEIMLDWPNSDKLKIIRAENLPKNTFLKDIILKLQLDTKQSRSYILPIAIAEAEELKYRLINKPLIFQAIVELNPDQRLIFETREYNFKYCVLKLTFQIISFIIHDYPGNKILEWRAK